MSRGTPSAWSRTAADLVTEILMASTNHRGTFLIVEGPTDELFLTRKVCQDVQFVLAGGRANCVSAVKNLNSMDTPFFYLAIIDEDFDWASLGIENLILTDTRDIESILIRSSALNAVIVEHGDKSRVSIFLRGGDISLIREELLSKALPFGKIRYVGYCKGSISLDAIKPQRFFRDGWTYDMPKAMAECVALGLSKDVNELASEIAAVSAPSDWHLTRGHDLIDILVGGLKSVLGTGCRAPEIESLLRQTMPDSEFVKTNLYARVMNWENHNHVKVWELTQ